MTRWGGSGVVGVGGNPGTPGLDRPAQACQSAGPRGIRPFSILSPKLTWEGPWVGSHRAEATY